MSSKGDKKESETEAKIDEGNKKDSLVEEEEGKLVEMKKGDYQIHVLIEEIKDAKCSTLEGSAKNLEEGTEARPPVPVVKITCLGKSKRTQKPAGPVKNHVYNEHFYFDGLNMTKEMLDSENIRFEVYDNDNTKKECYLGVQEFDFAFIYSKEGHVLKNFWMALANPYSSDFTSVRGYLKVSISVLHENDERKELVMKDADSAECFTPTQVKVHYSQMTISIFKAQKIPDMNEGKIFGIGGENKGNKATCNGQIEVSFGAMMQKTKKQKMVKEEIVWNEYVKFPVSEPCVSQKVKMIIKDIDTMSFDYVGSIELKIEDIRRGRYKTPQFLDIYGSYVNQNDKENNLMNTNAEIGSRWKGRLLISIDYEDIPKPILAVEPIKEPNELKKGEMTAREYFWKLLFGIYDVVFLPYDSSKYKLEIKCGDSEVPLPEKVAKNGSIYWGYSGSLTIATSTPELEETPDIFIYLTYKNAKICIQRLRCKDIYKNTSDLAIKLIPEYGINKASSVFKKELLLMDSGILNCKMGVFRNDKGNQDHYVKEDFDVDPPEEENTKTSKKAISMSDQDELMNALDEDDEDESSKMKEPEKPTVTSPMVKENFKVIAVVYMSKGLNPAKKNGSDLFVEIILGQVKKQTRIKKNTVNGVWMEGLEFENVCFDKKKLSSYPTMMVKVLHQGLMGSKALNYTYIWLSKSKPSIDEVKNMAEPRWYKLYTPKSNQQVGQLLMSFYIFSKESKLGLNNIQIVPKTVPYTFEINLLGLRDLKPLSLLPVKKPYIKFDLNSLNFTGSNDETLKEIQTTPGDPGCNPTINSIFKFDVNLPENERYIPELQCEVYDYVLSGMFKSLLGVFTLNVKRLAKKTQLRFKEDLSKIQEMKSKKLGESILGKTFTDMQSSAFFGINANSNKKQSEEEINTKKTKIEGKKEPLDIYKDEKKDNNLKEELIDKNADSDSILAISNSINESSTKLDKTVELQNSTSNIPLEQANATILPKTLDKNMKDDPKYFVRYPLFKKFILPGVTEEESMKDFWVENTDFKPDSEQYMEVGYLLKVDPGTKAEESTKHYRRIYGQPLETVVELNLKKPFTEEFLKRGKSEDVKDEKAIFELMTNPKKKILINYEEEVKEREEEEKRRIEENKQDESSSTVVEASSLISVQEYNSNKTKNEETYGKFKGIIRIAKKDQFDKYEKEVKKYSQDPKYEKVLKYMKKHEEICKKILVKTDMITRLYVLKLKDLAAKDICGTSDPYIKIYIGDKLFIDESKNHQNYTLNCDWCKYYDIPCTMPGSGYLRLEVWDYDHLLSDDFIGSTTIDLEDRYYCQNWQNLNEKPIEVRPLFHPDEQKEQGKAYLWLEMFPQDERSTPERIPRCIDLEPVIKYEVRLVIWSGDEIEMMDTTDTSDAYVLAFFDRKNKESTDVHYFLQPNCPASWNWRILLPFETPALSTKLSLQLYDKDIIGSDDYICGQELDIGDIVKIPKLLDIPYKFTKKYYDALSENEKKKFCSKPIEFEDQTEDPKGEKFWVQCVKEDAPSARILCSLEILPEWKAKLNPVGKGREEPNIDPYLPPPFGRFQWTLNPYKLINQCVGPKFRRKCYLIICGILCCIYLVCVVPYCIYHLSAELINPFNKK
jgi:hypothetical protein